VILAIDPGPVQSAYVLYSLNSPHVWRHAIIPNEVLLASISTPMDRGGFHSVMNSSRIQACVIEMIASYGMAVGAEVFETCVWIGRFAERWQRTFGTPADRLFRREVKLHLCGQARAKDPNVRQALLDKFGGKERAVGKKASPGPLHGIRADEWAALAVAVTWAETRETKREAA